MTLNPASKSNRPRRKRLTITIVTLVFAAMLFTILDHPGGAPVTEVEGVIQLFRSPHLATVRLDADNIVQAKLARDSTAQVGDIAHIHVFHSAITRKRSYEIYRTNKPLQ